MKPTIQELHESDRYHLIESFKIDEMTQFLTRELGMGPAQKQLLHSAFGGKTSAGLCSLTTMLTTKIERTISSGLARYVDR